MNVERVLAEATMLEKFWPTLLSAHPLSIELLSRKLILHTTRRPSTDTDEDFQTRVLLFKPYDPRIKLGIVGVHLGDCKGCGVNQCKGIEQMSHDVSSMSSGTHVSQVRLNDHDS